MSSQLFRRETGRRMRAVADDVIALYQRRRFPWLDSYSRPQPEAIRGAIAVLAEAAQADEATRYVDFAALQTERWISLGVPPIGILAMADVLYDTLLQFLTHDQQALLTPIIEAERQQRQALVYKLIMGSERRGA